MKKQFTDWLYWHYHTMSRAKKRRLLIVCDTVLFVIAIISAFSVRFNFFYPISKIFQFNWQILLLIVIKIVIFRAQGMYRPILRYSDTEFLNTATQAVLYSSVTQVILAYLLGEWPLPRSVLIIDALLTFILVIYLRLIIGWGFRQLKHRVRGNKQIERLVIYGAGVAGSQLARALIHESDYDLIGFVDDNPELRQQLIRGIPVYSPGDLPQLYRQKPFDAAILAIPSLNKQRRREIIEYLQELPILVKTVPSLTEILANKMAISEIRTIDVADLLGREEIKPEPQLLKMNITNKSVLVTGAGGSIGSELCRQIAQLQPKCLIIYEISEFSLYSIDIELAEKYPELYCVAYLGSVTDETHLKTVLAKHRVDTIYHAAAYKHVPLVEANPSQGVYNNVYGTLVSAKCAIASGVSNFVLISTDKAVRPTNVMGASKRTAELVIQALSDRPDTCTCFAIVRFGNVLDSSGSVVPRFRHQIAQGKAITVTHPDVTRYFMSIPEAVRLVIQAGAMAKGGEVFLLDMGEPIRIYDLALQMIRLSGLVPERDIKIEITGLRPGEKLYEELLIDGDNINRTQHPKIFCAYERLIPWLQLEPLLEVLLTQAQANQHREVILYLQKLVPEYQSTDKLLTQPMLPECNGHANR
ncbi:nucleoside-diphosphate sugar epimerase/dehydratase [Gloeocapsa sp. PCC 73106]|uniref:polysaccharide biosynthesis protein n=1 Tax=Gloeocapsa sp. PCC 73106 TaxID=102232 RepID=UPI00030718DF|nr:nucleoside-diphosphate sugar epimerase/dehydratase [Gloeocapsa sp. PCC 73106]